MPLPPAIRGSLDEVHVYGNALSSPQIQNLYANNVGAWSEYAISNASFSGSPNSTATYTLPIAITYQVTPAPGWSISITSTALFDGGTHYMPNTASTITAVTATCTTSGTCSGDLLTNTTTTLPVPLPAGNTAPGSVRFFATAAGTGTGTYTSTITLTAIAGP